jgi:hypothetical protein
MKVFVLLIHPVITDFEQFQHTLRELLTWEHDKNSLAVFRLNPEATDRSVNEIKKLWPRHLNLFGSDDEIVQVAFEMAHLAIRLNADVFQIGDPTGIEQLFESMGIEVSKLPIE